MNDHLYNETEKALLISNYETNEEIRLYGNGDTVDFQPVVKWFDQFGAATWLISEIDPMEKYAFGLCDLGMGFPEMGSVAIDDITAIKSLGIHRIVKDEHWSATQPLTQYANAARVAGRINEPSLDMSRVCDAIEESWRSTYNPGFCTECGNEQDGCEPDAEGYECEACGKHAVSGAETCLLGY